MPLTYVAGGRRPDARRLAAAILFAAGLTAPLALSACLPSVGTPSLAALAHLNPITVDPGQLRAAVRLPDTVRIVTSALTVTADLTGLATPEVRHFQLITSRDPAERMPLASEVKDGFSITVLRLDTEQAAALADWRRDFPANRHGRLTLGLRTDACRLSGDPDGPVPLTVYIAASPAGGYAVLTAEHDLATLAATMDTPQTLPPCAAGQ